MSDDIDAEMRDHDLEICRRAAAELMKHFDAVQIFATRHEVKHTVSITAGLGSWFARFGQVSLWVKSEADKDSREAAGRDSEEE